MTAIDHHFLLVRALRRLFPDEHGRAAVGRILDLYGVEPHHREPVRVRLAVLKLAGSEPARVRYYIDEACRDYRDVLALAEYPGQLRSTPTGRRDPARQAVLIEEDRRQYEEWINGLLED